MVCRVYHLGPGVTAIACGPRGARGKPQRCAFCSAPGLKLCDGRGPLAGKSCDRPICPDHARHIGPDLDLCPACAFAGQPMPPIEPCACGKQVIRAQLEGRQVVLLPTPNFTGPVVLERKAGQLVAEEVDPERHRDRRRWAWHACPASVR